MSKQPRTCVLQTQHVLYPLVLPRNPARGYKLTTLGAGLRLPSMLASAHADMAPCITLEV